MKSGQYFPFFYFSFHRMSCFMVKNVYWTPHTVINDYDGAGDHDDDGHGDDDGDDHQDDDDHSIHHS